MMLYSFTVIYIDFYSYVLRCNHFFFVVYILYIFSQITFIHIEKNNKKNEKKKVLNHSYLFWFKQEITKNCFYFILILHDY